MHRKLLASLAPLLAIAAFAVMPAAAQAVPHWYKSGVLLKEGQRVQTITWGTVSIITAVGNFICKKSNAEDIENPIGGGPGVDRMVLFDLYECVAPGCPLETRVEAFKLPWLTELTIGSGGEILHKIKGIKLVLGCWKGPPTGPGNVSTAERGIPEVLLSAEGELTPKWTNGPSATKPSFDECGPESALLSEIGPVQITCKDKYLGFIEQELIQVKNP
jgi:hypothetical protein